MKRSEMLRQIYILLNCGPDYPTEDEILDAIEAAGMLPPFDPEIYRKSWRDGGSGHEWEQE